MEAVPLRPVRRSLCAQAVQDATESLTVEITPAVGKDLRPAGAQTDDHRFATLE
jgi:hypothetical protein